MNLRDQLAALCGPEALAELDHDVAAAPPLTEQIRAELVAAFTPAPDNPDRRAA